MSELLCVKSGTISLRHLTFKVFDPTQGNYQMLLNQNSSYGTVQAPNSNFSSQHQIQDYKNQPNLGFAQASSDLPPYVLLNSESKDQDLI